MVFSAFTPMIHFWQHDCQDAIVRVEFEVPPALHPSVEGVVKTK